MKHLKKTDHDEFVNVELTIENLDRYYIRQSIFKAIRTHSIQFKGKLLDIGCGKMPYKNYILENSSVENYIGLDIEEALEYDKKVKPDFIWDGRTMPFGNNQFDTAIGTEVLEHCPKPDLVLNEINRVLKTGGCFFFTVPFLWPLHEVPHDEYRYTSYSLKKLLDEAGFINIELKATGGWHASLAQMMGLWVRRAPLNNRKRVILSFLFKPVIKYLIKIDALTAINFTESQMITGISGIAFKR
jgi:SAM-dependent methyltransferase